MFFFAYVRIDLTINAAPTLVSGKGVKKMENSMFYNLQELKDCLRLAYNTYPETLRKTVGCRDLITAIAVGRIMGKFEYNEFDPAVLAKFNFIAVMNVINELVEELGGK